MSHTTHPSDESVAEHEIGCAGPVERWDAPTDGRGRVRALPAVEDPERMRLSDVGNARRLVARHGPDMHYVPDWKQWLVWNGVHWQRDANGQMDRWATETTERMARQALRIGDERRRATVLHHARRSESDRRMRAMIARAATLARVPVSADSLDVHPWLLCCANGTLDLRTGHLRPHQRADLITRHIDVPYDPHATCASWQAFIDRVLGGDRELVTFVQRAVGYSLSGSTREQCLFFLYGTGANGKTTLVGALRRILGTYARQTPADTFMLDRSDTAPSHLARLRGARLVVVAESARRTRLAEALIKQLTGQDRVCARFLYSDWFEFTPEFKIWLVANHKPVVHHADLAMWRRIHVVPFRVAIPTEAQDKQLADKLHAQSAGILAWAVRGCLDWQRLGLTVPHAVADATRAYRDEMDELADFLADRCVVDPNQHVTARSLRCAYEGWCRINRIEALSSKKLGQLLGEHGFVRGKLGGYRVWHGIGLGA